MCILYYYAVTLFLYMCINTLVMYPQLLVVMLVGKEDSLAIVTSVLCAMTLICVLTATRLVRLVQADTVAVIQCNVYSLKQMLVSKL